MKRRRFIKTSVGAGFTGAGFALSPHHLFARFKPLEAGRANSQMDATETLARFISDFRYEDLSPQAVEAAKVGLIDGVGVMLAGSTYPAPGRADGHLCEGDGRRSLVQRSRLGISDQCTLRGLCQRCVRPLPGLRNTGLP